MKIKNLFKTLSAVLVAVILSFSIIVFSGCDDDNKADATNNPATSENPENPENNTDGANGGNTGNSQNGEKPDKPEKPNNPDTPDTPDEPLPDIGGTAESAELLQYLLKQETPYAGIDMALVSESVTDGYRVGEDGVKLNDGYSYKLAASGETGITVKINAVEGNGDITYAASSANSKEIAEDGETHSVDYSDEKTEYYFLRGGNLFLYRDYGGQPDSRVEDFTGKTLEWLGGYGEWENLSGGSYTGAQAAYVADVLGAFTVENGRATADFNLAAYNLVQMLKSVLNSIKLTTTVGDVLKNSTVKTLIEAFTSSLSPEDVKSYVISAIEELSAVETQEGATLGDMLEAMGIDVASYIVEPDENSTVYEYVVKIVGSKQLKNLINKIMEIYGNATGKLVVPMLVTLDKMSVNAMLLAAETSLGEVKSSFNELTKDITKTELKFTVNNSTATVQDYSGNEHSLDIPTSVTYSFKNLKLNYALEGNTLTGVSFDCDYSYSGTEIDASFEVDNNTGEVSVVEIIMCEVQSAGELTFNAEFPATAYKLEDVDGNEIEIVKKEWTDECNGNEVTFYINAADAGLDVNGSVRVYATVSVENGGVTGVAFADGDGNSIPVENGKITVEITYWGDKDGEYGEYAESVCLFVNAFEDDSAYCVFLTAEPAENAGADEFGQAVASGKFYKSSVYYVNTVEGIVNGEPAIKAPEAASFAS